MQLGLSKWRFLWALLILGSSLKVYSASVPIPPDPLNSPQWESMQQRFLADAPVVFDERIKILAPQSVEDSLNVPVYFQADALGDVDEVVVFADMNPLPLVLRFQAKAIKPNLGFRMKLQQGSPLRVAAKAADGQWHVGSVWIDAAGGGCTLPSAGTSGGDWASTLGQVSARIWQRPQDNRLRLQVKHPMDTGLASGIPKFHIETLSLRDAQTQQTLAVLNLYEPISEDPKLSFDVGAHQQFKLAGRDNNGNEIEAFIQ